MNFKLFIEQNESYMKDVRKTLRKIPKKHRALIRGYKWKFEPHNTLKNDDEHIGFIDEENKIIRIASPWNYGREYTVLHEIGHAVWKYLVDENLREKWKSLVENVKKKNKEGLDQDFEETFCMTYAQLYAKNKVTKFDHKRLVRFIDTEIPK